MRAVAWCDGIIDGRAKRVQARPFQGATPLVTQAEAEAAVSDAADWHGKLLALARTWPHGLAFGCSPQPVDWEHPDGRPWTLVVKVSPERDEWRTYQAADPATAIAEAWADLVDGPAPDPSPLTRSEGP